MLQQPQPVIEQIHSAETLRVLPYPEVYPQQAAMAEKKVMQTIARLVQQTDMPQGWILVIAPPCPVTKKMLERLNINSQRVLLIQQHQISRFDHLMRDALTCTTCSAVLCFLANEHPAIEDYRYLSAKYGTALVNMSGLEPNLTRTH